ncbi:hypothetical protein FRACYDRAFT_230486 [Fragilariopsis cylindrus CCMP1102]|uniref:Uncharacterized protein n=1 Tax=Fragilariopsis cylindrus CCMP1102 TaxID=635003 RepID=A0A1E7EL01_9STRA|nr:hypothetical protein FRACYDRAFT_230486 [Fragilariopsis cylindrus CCMP1102]|eukprot:OEU06592.1 hypothetical protein FRACYDRAFT_230486 [Fragilariopsis cylindrus CCMP1102]
MPDYTLEEIRKWKALIYGPNIGCGNKVDGWASVGNETLTPRRKNRSKSKSGSIPSKQSSSSPSLYAEWLGGSPCGANRSYRTKGAKDAIGKPSLY